MDDREASGLARCLVAGLFLALPFWLLFGASRVPALPIIAVGDGERATLLRRRHQLMWWASAGRVMTWPRIVVGAPEPAEWTPETLGAIAEAAWAAEEFVVGMFALEKGDIAMAASCLRAADRVYKKGGRP